MNWKKLAPWNWFKKEEEENSNRVSVNSNQNSITNANQQLFDLQKQVHELFNSFFNKTLFPNFPSLSNNESLWNGFLKPTLDIAADDEQYTTTIELPGVEPSEVKIELHQNNLYISGEKKQVTETKDTDYYRLERSYGSFKRVLSLPEDAKLDDITATFKNGIMTIKIPRQQLPENKKRQIEVKTA